jgi:ABC-type multidrug transport system fused ATPase/permease subunit
MNSTLSKQQESFCEKAGIVGVLISLACLMQHVIFMIPNWVTISVIFVYCLCIVGFVLLAKKKVVAPKLLLTSGILVLVVEIVMTFSFTFSLIILILLIYLIVIVVISLAGGLSEKLKQKALEEKEEANKWEGIL